MRLTATECITFRPHLPDFHLFLPSSPCLTRLAPNMPEGAYFPKATWRTAHLSAKLDQAWQISHLRMRSHHDPNQARYAGFGTVSLTCPNQREIIMPITIRRFALLVLPTTVLAACANLPNAPTTSTLTAPPSSVSVITKSAGAAPASPRNMVVDVTPLTEFSDLDSKAGPQGQDFGNTYTRVTISSTISATKDGEEDPVSLQYQKRNALYRYLLGKKSDINLAANIKVGEYETTASLLTLSHQSDRNGEFWNRSVGHELLNFPLFLIRPDGDANIPEISFVLSGSSEYSSNMAGTALQIAIAGIQQVSPEASVLTKLTTQASKDKAQAIDKAIQNLFANGIKETHVSHRDLRRWNPNGGVAVLLRIPTKEGNWDVNSLEEVGTWKISFAAPRPSIFADWSICTGAQPRCQPTRAAALHAVHAEINPGQVLSYNLLQGNSSLGSIRSYLQQQDWFATAMTGFGNPNTDQKTAENLCKNIGNAITSLGLNGDDADIVIWAALKAMPLTGTINPGAFTGPYCSAAVTRATL